MTSKLHVLGAGSAFNDTGLANSLHVLTHGTSLMLLDCGPTSLMQLKKHGYDTTSITHIYISHLHGDHFGGIPIMYLEFMHVNPPKQRIKVLCPNGLKQRLLALQDLLFPNTEDKLEEYFEFISLTDHDEYEDDMIHVQTLPAVHAEQPRMALIQYKDSAVIGYTGDSDLQKDSHHALLTKADLTLIECMTYTTKIPGHLSFKELKEIIPENHNKPVIIIHAGTEVHEKQDEIHDPFIIARDGFSWDIENQ